jgi:mitogen-activated protein kinase 15
MEEPADQELVIMTDYIATRWYRAPELLLGSKDYNKEVDMWALGCLIGEMFYGKAMFPGNSTINQIEKVVAWTGTPSAQDLKHLNPNLPNNILQLLNTRKKQSKADFFSGKVSTSCLDLISRLLEFNPSKRLTIEEVLKHEYLS